MIKIGSTKIEVKNDGTVNITATTINMNGNVNITGNVATTGTLQNNGKNVGSTHSHSGVQAGGSNTGVPV